MQLVEAAQVSGAPVVFARLSMCHITMLGQVASWVRTKTGQTQ